MAQVKLATVVTTARRAVSGGAGEGTGRVSTTPRTIARFRSRTRSDISYRVVKDAATGELRCECEGFRFRRRCRHVKATEMVYEGRGRPATCPGCGGGMPVDRELCETCEYVKRVGWG